MYPILKDGDVVRYHRTSFARVRINDIVLIRQRDSYVTHRVIHKTSRSAVTRGDNNSVSDGYITQNRIVAVVDAVTRNGKTFRPDDLYTHQSHHYLAEIVRLKTVLELSGIPYLFLKGLPLHLYYERAIPRRLYADFDILVDKKDAGRVNGLLRKLGFVSEKKQFYRSYQRFIGADWKEVTYLKKIGRFGVAVDVHFEITFLTHKTKNPFPRLQKAADALTQRFMARKRVITVRGEHYPIMDADDLVLYLFLHYFTHNFRGAHRLGIIRNMLMSERVHWDKVFGVAKQNACVLFLIASLSYYETCHGSVVPRAVRRAYAKEYAYVAWVRSVFMRDIDIFSEGRGTGPERMRRALYMFLLYDGFLGRKILDILNPALILHYIVFTCETVYAGIRGRNTRA